MLKVGRGNRPVRVHICAPLFYSLYYTCASMCAMCTLCFKGRRVVCAWHQPPYVGKYNPSPTLRLNKLKLRCPSRSSLHENGSCSALRSGECNHWHLRTNKVAFHTRSFLLHASAWLHSCSFFLAVWHFMSVNVMVRAQNYSLQYRSIVFSNTNLENFRIIRRNKVSLFFLLTSDVQECY